MASIKDVNRLFKGISLVAKEFLRRSEVLESGKFETLISKSLKKAVVAATDLSGLTKGKVKPFSSNNSTVVSSASSSSSNRDSVVYFNHDHVENPDCGTSAAIVLDEINVEKPDCSNQREHDRVQVHVPVPVVELESKSSVDNKVIESQSPSRVDMVDRGLVVESLADRIEPQHVNAEGNVENRQAEKVSVPIPVPIKKRTPRERRVPSTPAARVVGFAGLGIGLAWGAFSESTKRLVYGNGTPTTQGKQSAVSPFLSEQNAERLALGLCRMRGAALKLGQMLSIQDESLVPAPILAALEIVRQGADVMPRSQLNQVLDAGLGSNWTSKLTSFDYEPLASASIGQVHRAVMKDGTHVAMKIQYPGVADSIESDIDNVKMMLNYTNLIPKGLYLDSAMKVAKEELSRECDYVLEASNQKRFRELLANKKGVCVPMVFEEISSKRVLTTELIKGIPIDKVALVRN